MKRHRSCRVAAGAYLGRQDRRWLATPSIRRLWRGPTLEEWRSRFCTARLNPELVIRGNLRVPEHEGAKPVVVGRVA